MRHSKESEMIYQQQGLEAFIDHEKRNAQQPLPEGPFAKLLKTLSIITQPHKIMIINGLAKHCKGHTNREVITH